MILSRNFAGSAEPSERRSPGSANTVKALRTSASTSGAAVADVVGVIDWPMTQMRKLRERTVDASWVLAKVSSAAESVHCRKG